MECFEGMGDASAPRDLVKMEAEAFIGRVVVEPATDGDGDDDDVYSVEYDVNDDDGDRLFGASVCSILGFKDGEPVRRDDALLEKADGWVDFSNGESVGEGSLIDPAV